MFVQPLHLQPSLLLPCNHGTTTMQYLTSLIVAGARLMRKDHLNYNVQYIGVLHYWVIANLLPKAFVERKPFQRFTQSLKLWSSAAGTLFNLLCRFH